LPVLYLQECPRSCALRHCTLHRCELNQSERTAQMADLRYCMLSSIGVGHVYELRVVRSASRGCDNSAAMGFVSVSGTDYWGTQRGGTNNYQTLMLPNRREHNYTPCPYNRRLAAPRPSPEGWTLPRPMAEGRLHLA